MLQGCRMPSQLETDIAFLLNVRMEEIKKKIIKERAEFLSLIENLEKARDLFPEEEARKNYFHCFIMNDLEKEAIRRLELEIGKQAKAILHSLYK